MMNYELTHCLSTTKAAPFGCRVTYASPPESRPG